MSLPTGLLTLDVAYNGLPYCYVQAQPGVSLLPMDEADNGLPYVSNQEQIYPEVFSVTISITAPEAMIEGWHRKMPNPRLEMVYSQQEFSHVFPYIAPQTPSLLP